MTRDEFEILRRLPGKEISADIEFVRVRHLPNEVVVFDGAQVDRLAGINHSGNFVDPET